MWCRHETLWDGGTGLDRGAPEITARHSVQVADPLSQANNQRRVEGRKHRIITAVQTPELISWELQICNNVAFGIHGIRSTGIQPQENEYCTHNPHAMHIYTFSTWPQTTNNMPQKQHGQRQDFQRVNFSQRNKSQWISFLSSAFRFFEIVHTKKRTPTHNT